MSKVAMKRTMRSAALNLACLSADGKMSGVTDDFEIQSLNGESRDENYRFA
jgi:hypothetical protein